MKAAQTVLHVEDDESLQFLFGRIFEKEGFDYHAVPGVEQAMAYVQQQPPFEDEEQFPPPDVVITDLGLSSRGSAVEFIRWLRQRPEHSETPIVVLTGGADRAVEEKAMHAGASAFVIKGESIRDVLEQMRAAFRVAGVR